MWMKKHEQKELSIVKESGLKMQFHRIGKEWNRFGEIPRNVRYKP